MTIAPKYDPGQIEDKWYKHWMDSGFFHSEPDTREPYCVVIPPPNVTGVLHMGHMLNNTIQDVLVRRARMQGKNACWVPGTDHASIATEAKVVKMLSEQGIAKKDISRETFLEHAWDWTNKYGGIILEQLKKLGASCDWERTRFTLEPKLYDAVITVFIDLYRKGLIYRGTKMVNWDPAGKTTLSDEEVIFREVPDQLYYVRYQVEGSEQFVLVATARPETIAGDVAVCVHPEDERYKALIGKNVIVPLIGRAVKVITDEYIDREFGTGVLKVTPAHDIHDYEIGMKYNLPVIDTLNDDGTISEAGQLFVGMDRAEARKAWVKELEAAGLLEKTEDYTHNVGFSERTNAVVEPKISTQWFMDMKQFMEKNPQVLTSVMDDSIQFYPAKFKNTYQHWITNLKDWNISRQLWWGQRIPAWYHNDGSFEVAKTAEEAALQFAARGVTVPAESLQQDNDVLDTWFSSWLWPISVFDGFENPDNADISYYYPTNDLVTGPDIIFFWVARMIMAGYEFRGKLPFRNVYFTGIVRDKQRRKMSKSLGNSPEPMDLIAKYGADAVRMGILLSSPAGNDILYDESQLEQGRNFCNKLWNAYRLVSGWNPEQGQAQRPNEVQAIRWFESGFSTALAGIESKFSEFRLSEALMDIYKLIWDDFCNTLLEAVKPPYGEPASAETVNQVRQIYDRLLRMLHPFMPFITEELHHAMFDMKPEKACIVSDYPRAGSAESISSMPIEVVTQIRMLRNEKNIPPRETLDVVVISENTELQTFRDMIEKLANCRLQVNAVVPEGAVQLLAGTATLHIQLHTTIDVEAERERIGNEIQYLEGFLNSVNAKLNNEKFVANAKADVVEKEKQKKADAESKLDNLRQQLSGLS